MDRNQEKRRIGGGDVRVEREFKRARRNSLMVKLLKIGLPLVAVAIILGGAAVTWLARSLPDNLAVDSTRIEDGRVVMQDPRMSGTDSKGRPYQLIARQAFQSLTGGGVDLDQVNAKIAIDDDTQANIEAANGHYAQGKNQLELSGGIKVETTNGVTVNLDNAAIDVGNGSMRGGGPVLIETPNQTIRSKTIDLSDGGKKVSFGGGVKLLLKPSGFSDTQRQASNSE